MQKLILKNSQSPGDIVMMTAAVRDLHLAHPGIYQTDVRTPCNHLWENNPYITPLPDGEGEELEIGYPLIHGCNQKPYHFIHGFRMDLEQKLGVAIPAGPFRGDIHISDKEKSWIPQVEGSFWIIVSGGKKDFTAKHWDADRWQQVVDRMEGRIRFVQVGEGGHIHPALEGVIDLRGKTDLRQLVRLVYHSEGVLCGVTSLMHLAAAVPTKTGRLRPCVVVAGGREPAHWEQYPGHRFLDTVGALDCCSNGGCWKSRVIALPDNDKQNDSLCAHPVQSGKSVIPRCMDMISTDDVVRAIESYFPAEKAKYEPEKKKPCGGGCGQVVKTAFKAAGRAVAAVLSGEPLLVPDDERKARLAQCANCEHLEKATASSMPRCAECGCFVKLKASLATESCPIGKWGSGVKVGVVVGTFAAVPHVHMQLEAAKRLYPHVRILVSDDGSPKREELADLCAQYGADFTFNEERHAQFLGDVSVYGHGMKWAQKHGLHYLVKLSRRWIWTEDWTPSFLSLVAETDADTVSHHCLANDFGFRTECVGFKVSSWGHIVEWADRVVAADKNIFVEYDIHRLAERVAAKGSPKWREWDKTNKSAHDRRGYAPWPYIGNSRHTKTPNHLWHNCNTHDEYAAVAQSWGLAYTAKDFADPNAGQGNGYAVRK